MARTARTRKTAAATEDNNLSAISLGARPKPLVFISHDSRDGDLAEVFSNLLLDVSGGMLKSFRSSDRKGTAGIEFGEEWYATIISQLGDATDVVALLSQQSIDRPWILYEAGLAKGRLETTVIGVALGVPLDRVITGPFGQFHNCADDEDSQTKLVMQLLQRNPEATPREETIRGQVQIFRGRVEGILKSRGKQSAPPLVATDEQTTAKLFEEVKAMVRELPERVDERVRSATRKAPFRRMRRLHPRILEELTFNPVFGEFDDAAPASWLVFISLLRDEFPWIYEVGMELYRAMRSGNAREIERARRDLLLIVEVTTRGPFIHEIVGIEDKESYFLLRHLGELIEPFLSRVRVRSSERKVVPAVTQEKGEDDKKT